MAPNAMPWSAAGRRLKAMQALVEDGVLDPDHPVPCLVAADRDTVGELSLAENVVRIAMHPVDQVTAFTNLTTAGLSVSAIADARFGMSSGWSSSGCASAMLPRNCWRPIVPMPSTSKC